MLARRLGPVQMDLTVKKRVVTQKIKRLNEKDAVTAATGLDEKLEQAGDSDEVARSVQAALQAVDTSGGGELPLMEFIVNPKSYAQTVENMFALAYLVSALK